MDVLTRIWALGAKFDSGDISEEDLVEGIAGIAYESGATGEAEEAMTALAYVAITGKAWNSNDWA